MHHRVVPLLPSLLLLLVACAEDRTPPPAGGAESSTTEGEFTGSAEVDPPVALTREEAEAAVEGAAEARDEAARKLLESHEARVYDPERDSGLERVAGRLTGSVGDEVHEFTMEWPVDGDSDLLDVERVDATLSPPRPLAQLVADVSRLAAKGASPLVIVRRPPIRYHALRGQDGRWIVRVPKHRGEVSTSYRFDDEQTITVVGHVSDRGKHIVHFEYDHYKGRYLLNRMQDEGSGVVTEFEYEEQAGVILPVRATRTVDEQVAVVTCTWDDVDATPRIR